MTDLAKRRKEFEHYASAKANEIDEQRLAWRYYHSLQYTPEQLKILRDRNQPAIVFDRTSRKIDGVVGIARRLRTDPKVYPNTDQEQQAADIATQVIRTICDQSDFEDIETECIRDAAVHGIGVAEVLLGDGDQGDPDITYQWIDPRTFFYDPRSMRQDFADCRYMGTYKLATLDEIDEIVPGGADMVRGADTNYTTAFSGDREINWIDEKDRAYLVDHWYIQNGMWHWCLHAGTTELLSGVSPFFDERGRSLCKYHAFSNQVDQDGTRYGFVRRLKGPQDAINQHRSKAIHIMNTRQIKLRRGSVIDVNALRREARKPDGVLEYDGSPDEFEIIQPAQEFLQQTQYFEDAKKEIEAFGPNPALLGDMGASASGRAYAIAQQAGLAELGPFLKNYRSWKLALWKAGWFAAKRYWTNERKIRVTDNDNAVQFMQVNGIEIDEYGMPVQVNPIGAIDVDIRFSEGPDTETVMGDVFDTLSALAQNGVPVPPAALVEMSALPQATKKRIVDILSQPDPAADAAKQIELRDRQAKTEETQSRTILNIAKAQTHTVRAPQVDLPPDIKIAQAITGIQKTNADIAHKMAQAKKTNMDADIAQNSAPLLVTVS
jgi:hypothetical protein